MKEIIKDCSSELIINKSRFITYIKKVSTVEDAKSYIQEIKKLHPSATHHITLYCVGNGGEIGHTTDDGEPSGTAGLPAFEVFKKNDITNYVCIIVRYFGGIKLGAGGLIRAYSSSASNIINEAGIRDIINYQELQLTFNYNLEQKVIRLLKDAEIINKKYQNNVEYTIKINELLVDDLIKNLIDQTLNQIIINKRP